MILTKHNFSFECFHLNLILCKIWCHHAIYPEISFEHYVPLPLPTYMCYVKDVGILVKRRKSLVRKIYLLMGIGLKKDWIIKECDIFKSFQIWICLCAKCKVERREKRKMRFLARIFSNF